jgi:hypothetical protein
MKGEQGSTLIEAAKLSDAGGGGGAFRGRKRHTPPSSPWLHAAMGCILPCVDNDENMGGMRRHCRYVLCSIGIQK